MSKYIDAEKLKKLISKKYCEFRLKGFKEDPIWYHYADGLDFAKQLIDSLQQEQPEDSKGKFVFPKFLYARTTDNKTIDVSYAPQSMDAIEYVRNNFAEGSVGGGFSRETYQEFLYGKQSEVDLERDAVSYCYDNGINISPRQAKGIARHFYELGLKTRKEE